MRNNVNGHQVFIIKLMILGSEMVWGMTIANNSTRQTKNKEPITALF